MKLNAVIFEFVLVTVCAFSVFSAHASAAPNLAPNPGFETVNSDGRAKYYDGIYELSSTEKHTGRHSIRHKYKTSLPRSSWNAVASQKRITVNPGQKYIFSVWCKNSVTEGGISFGVRYDKKNEEGNLTGFAYSFAEVGTNVSGWQKHTMTFTPPARTEAMVIYFVIDDNVASGDVFWDDMVLQKAPPPLMSFKPLPASVFFKAGNNSYFDVNSNAFVPIDPATVNLDIGLEPRIKGYSLKTKMFRTYSDSLPPVWSDTRVVRTNNRSNESIPLKINNLEPGVYTVTTDLFDKNGNPAAGTASKKISILDHPNWLPEAEPVQTVEIGGDNMINVNGKPVFPVFVSHPDLNADYLRNMRNNFGLNFSQVWCPGSNADTCIADIKRKLDLCLSEKYYCTAVLFHAWAYDGENKIWRYDALEKAVKALKDHPALLFWDLIDEPDGNGVASAEVHKAYDFVKSIDSKHPVWVNLSLKNKFSEYLPYSDFASFDSYYYPIRPLISMDNWNRSILESCNNSKPLVSYLQTFNWVGFDPPPPEQLKAEVYLDITRDMRVFGYYSWQEYDDTTMSLNRNRDLQSAVKEINYQLAALSDFLQSQTGVQPSIEVFDNMPGVRYIFKNVGAKRYLIVVNGGARNYSSYNIPLPEYTGATAVGTMFEDNRIPNVSNGILQDSLKGYEAHVYVY